MLSSTPTSDGAMTMSLADVLRALGLDHAASTLDAATSKAITRNDSPTSLLYHLMREELRVQTEKRAQRALKRSAIFPTTTLDTYDFDYRKSIDREAVERAATLAFIKDGTNVVLSGPSGVGKTPPGERLRSAGLPARTPRPLRHGR
jgi:DNA replication protein DnaC